MIKVNTGIEVRTKTRLKRNADQLESSNKPVAVPVEDPQLYDSDDYNQELPAKNAAAASSKPPKNSAKQQVRRKQQI